MQVSSGCTARRSRSRRIMSSLSLTGGEARLTCPRLIPSQRIWRWQSKKPGIRVRPRKSITRVPDSARWTTSLSAPTARTRPSLPTATACALGFSVSIVRILPFFSIKLGFMTFISCFPLGAEGRQNLLRFRPVIDGEDNPIKLAAELRARSEQLREEARHQGRLVLKHAAAPRPEDQGAIVMLHGQPENFSHPLAERRLDQRHLLRLVPAYRARIHGGRADKRDAIRGLPQQIGRASCRERV